MAVLGRFVPLTTPGLVATVGNWTTTVLMAAASEKHSVGEKRKWLECSTTRGVSYELERFAVLHRVRTLPKHSPKGTPNMSDLAS